MPALGSDGALDEVHEAPAADQHLAEDLGLQLVERAATLEVALKRRAGDNARPVLELVLPLRPQLGVGKPGLGSDPRADHVADKGVDPRDRERVVQLEVADPLAGGATVQLVEPIRPNGAGVPVLGVAVESPGIQTPHVPHAALRPTPLVRALDRRLARVPTREVSEESPSLIVVELRSAGGHGV